MTDEMQIHPNWVLAFIDDTGLAGDDQLPNYVVAYTEEQFAEYGRLMAKQQHLLRVSPMTLGLLQEVVDKTPAIEGVSLVFGMGPLVPWKGTRAREIRKACIKRAAFLSIE